MWRFIQGVITRRGRAGGLAAGPARTAAVKHLLTKYKLAARRGPPRAPGALGDPTRAGTVRRTASLRELLTCGAHLPELVAAEEIHAAVAALAEDLGRVVGALSAFAVEEERGARGRRELREPRAKLVDRHVQRRRRHEPVARALLARAHIHHNRAGPRAERRRLVPRAGLHQPVTHVLRNLDGGASGSGCRRRDGGGVGRGVRHHAREVDRVLGAAEGRGVAQLELREVVDRHAAVHRRRHHVDALLYLASRGAAMRLLWEAAAQRPGGGGAKRGSTLSGPTAWAPSTRPLAGSKSSLSSIGAAPG